MSGVNNRGNGEDGKKVVPPRPESSSKPTTSRVAALKQQFESKQAATAASSARSKRSSVTAADKARMYADDANTFGEDTFGKEANENKQWVDILTSKLPAPDLLGGLRAYVARRLVANEVATGEQVKQNTVPSALYKAIVKQRNAVKAAKTAAVLEQSGVRVSYSKLLATPLAAVSAGAAAANKERGETGPEETVNFYKMVLSIIGNDIKSSAPKFTSAVSSATSSVVEAGKGLARKVSEKTMKRATKDSDEEDAFLEYESREEEEISAPRNVTRASSEFKDGTIKTTQKPFTAATVRQQIAKINAQEAARVAREKEKKANACEMRPVLEKESTQNRNAGRPLPPIPPKGRPKPFDGRKG